MSPCWGWDRGLGVGGAGPGRWCWAAQGCAARLHGSTGEGRCEQRAGLFPVSEQRPVPSWGLLLLHGAVLSPRVPPSLPPALTPPGGVGAP